MQEVTLGLAEGKRSNIKLRVAIDGTDQAQSGDVRKMRLGALIS